MFHPSRACSRRPFQAFSSVPFAGAALLREARGRRLFPAAPENSLLLTKAAGIVAHGGGKRLEVGSDEFRLIRRWIAAGAPFGEKTDPVITRITVSPEHRILTRQNKQLCQHIGNPRRHWF